MCTVLQQHLRSQNGGGVFLDNNGTLRSPEPRATTASSSYYHASRTMSPPATPAAYSYLGPDSSQLKRPIEPYDRICATPTMHFHVLPPNPDGTRPSSRQKNAYTAGLYGRRSRSHSRSGMRVLVEHLKATQTSRRPRSPHMNNEEPIKLSHYPDGVAPDDETGAPRKPPPIERDDFPAPPFPYSDDGAAREEKRRRRRRMKRRCRRRHWSEPGKRMYGLRDDTTTSEDEEAPAAAGKGSDDSSHYESSSSDSEKGRGKGDDEEMVDPKLEKTEAELRKISSGMGKVFLTEIAMEKERRKAAKHRMIDPRSASRTPGANHEPHFRLRYDCPVNASPSRIADHLRPWDDDMLDGTRSVSRRSYCPYFGTMTPQQAGALGRIVSPVSTVKPGYTQQGASASSRAATLPARFTPPRNRFDSERDDGSKGKQRAGSGAGYSTDFSSKSDDLSDGEQNQQGQGRSGRASGTSPMIGTTQTSTPKSAVGGSSPAAVGPGTAVNGVGYEIKAGSVADSFGDSGGSSAAIGLPLQAPNVYPLHLLLTINYRLPGDVDRANLERHMTDEDFEEIFRMSRMDFYTLPYWKRNVLGKLCFGFEECGQYDLAMDAGVKALDHTPNDVWAIHSVAHIHASKLELQEGSTFVKNSSQRWATRPGFSTHMWWHLALFDLEEGHFEAALTGLDDHVLRGAKADVGAFPMSDATSLLLRLDMEKHRLPGTVDLKDRWREIAQLYKGLLEDAPPMPEATFYDFHMLLGLAMGDQRVTAEQLADAMAKGGCGESAEEQRDWNKFVLGKVGQGLSQGLLAFVDGKYAEAVNALFPIRHDLRDLLGGSLIQKSILSLVLLRAAINAGPDFRSTAEELLEESAVSTGFQSNSGIHHRLAESFSQMAAL